MVIRGVRSREVLVANKIQFGLETGWVIGIAYVSITSASGLSEELEFFSVSFSGDNCGGCLVLRNGSSVPGRDSVVGVAVNSDVHAGEGGSYSGEFARDLELRGDCSLNLTHEGHGLRDIIFVTVHHDPVGIVRDSMSHVVNGNSGVYIALGARACEGGVDDAFKGLHELVAIRVTVGTIIEKLTEEIANAVSVVDVEAHHFIDKLFWSVVCLVRDDVIVTLKEDGDWEVTTKVHVFGVGGERGNVCNVGAARISTGSDSLQKLD